MQKATKKLRTFTIRTDSMAATLRLIKMVNDNPNVWFLNQDGETIITTGRPRMRFTPTRGYYTVEKIAPKRKAVKKAA